MVFRLKNEKTLLDGSPKPHDCKNSKIRGFRLKIRGFCVVFEFKTRKLLDTLKVLWSSVVKLAKKFNSTSFSLKQEAFIRRDEDWPEEGWYLYRTWFDNFNIHTSFGGWLICDQCHCGCEVTFAIKSEVWWHVFTP